MNCNKCGSPLNPDSKFCAVCGAEVGGNVNSLNQNVPPMDNGNVVNETANQNGTLNNVEANFSNDNIDKTSQPNNELNNQIQPNPTFDVNQPVMQTTSGENVMNENNQVLPQQTSNTTKSGINKTGLIVVIVAVVIVVGLILVLALTGGIKFQATITSNGTTKQLINNKTTESLEDDNKRTTQSTTNSISNSGGFNVFEKIKQIDLNTIKSYEQVVSIMGVEGVKDETTTLNKYVWTQDDKTNMEINFYVSDTNLDYKSITNVNINYDRDSLKNANVDLSEAMTIVNTINAQTPVYYNEIVSSFGVEGTLVELSSYSREYVWVNENGGYVTARFNQDTAQCTYIFAIVK